MAVFTISETAPAFGGGSMPTPVQSTTSLMDDGIGSTDVMTDDSGNVTRRFSYDAWGMRRDPVHWTIPGQTIKSPVTVTDQGFTGHVSLDSVQLVHMGGRVYDPIIGRVMTPDIDVQAPDLTQNYNRYSYCMNTPASFTDPTGNDWLGMFTGGLSDIIGTFSSIVRHLSNKVEYWMGTHPIVGETTIAVTVVAVSAATCGVGGALLTPIIGATWAGLASGVAGAAISDHLLLKRRFGLQSILFQGVRAVVPLASFPVSVWIRRECFEKRYVLTHSLPFEAVEACKHLN